MTLLDLQAEVERIVRESGCGASLLVEVAAWNHRTRLDEVAVTYSVWITDGPDFYARTPEALISKVREHFSPVDVTPAEQDIELGAAGS